MGSKVDGIGEGVETLKLEKVEKTGDSMSGDLEFTLTTAGTVYRSPNSNRWRIGIDNNGIVNVEKII